MSKSKKTSKKAMKKPSEPGQEPEPELEVKITPVSGKINPIKNSIIQLTGQNLEAHRVKGRKTTTLNFEGVKNPEQNTFKKLASNLKGHRNLQKLSIKWPTKEGGMEKMPFILHKLRSLKDLSIDFKGYDNLIVTELVHLKKGLKSLPSLESLSLDFNRQYLQETTIRFFMNPPPLIIKGIFTKLRTLERISMGFKNAMSDLEMKFLLENFDRLTKLREFSLNFHDRRYSNEKEIKLINLKNFLQKHTSLDKFSLKFKEYFLDPHVSDAELNDLREGLQAQTDLKHITLQFSSSNMITDVGVDYLNEALKKMTALESISLDFSRCEKITETGLSYLKESFQSCQTLQNISLSFYKCGPKMTNAGVSELKEGLQTLPSLKHLALDFRHCKKVTNAGVGHLNDCLLGFKSLQRLFLQFDGCKQVTENGILALKEGLQASTSLEHLSLGFDGDYISDDGVTYLKNGIKTMTSLKYFSLQIGNSDITDDAIKSLKKAFQLMPSITYIHLDLYLSKLTDKGLKLLKKSLQEMNSLQYFHLRCKQNKMTSDGISDFEESLKRLKRFPSLQNFSFNSEKKILNNLHEMYSFLMRDE